MRSRFILRLRLISVLFLLVALVMAGRLYVLQVVDAKEYAARADRQYVQPSGGLFDRGTIYFSNKNGDLTTAAGLQSGFTLALDPRKVIDPEALYEALAPLLPLEREDFLARAGKFDDPHEDIAHRVSEETAAAIEAKGLPGVVLYRERWRYYPGRSLAAHTLGFLAYRDNELEGRYGLERYYADVLRRDTPNLYANFFTRLFSDVEGLLAGESRQGDIITTIEPTVAVTLERTLRESVERFGARGGGAIIMNPQNGEIYAMAAEPSFDLNNFSRTSTEVFGNPLVERVYEMGSIIKALTVAAGLDSGKITAGTTYDDRGFVTLNNKTIENFDGKGRGVVDMQEVLNQSLNTGVTFVMQRMGRERFSEYMRAYGLGEETGIDLPGEIPGLTSNLNSPRDIEHATASFGQGIAMTPVATVRALAALANGGVLVTPHLVREVRESIGTSRTIAHDEGKRVLKKETSEEISRMLTRVVDEALIGGAAKMEHYSIAAKTGTAEIASPEGGYYDDRFLHSFFGYFPSYDATFLIFLYLNEPRGVRYASQTLTEPFLTLVKFLINYYQVPPDR